MTATGIGVWMLTICHMRCMIFSHLGLPIHSFSLTIVVGAISFLPIVGQELLELGDRIGYVSTGLREEEIVRCLRKMKHSILDALPPHLSAGMEWKCSICQVGGGVVHSILGCI